MKISREKRLLLASLLIASCIVLARFLSIRTSILTISFSFVPIALGAIILGPVSSILIAVISDLIGALLFPSDAFFVGYTVTAALTGTIFGLCLSRPSFKVNRNFIFRLILSSVLVCTIANGILNTLWVVIMYQNGAFAVIGLRILKQLIMCPIMVLTLLAISKTFETRIQKFRGDPVLQTKTSNPTPKTTYD